MKRASTLGVWAQLLVIALMAGTAAGVVWGLLRPAYVGSFEGEEFVVDEVASPANVEFATFGSFALVCAGLGFLIAIVAYLRRLTGLGPLLWVIACSAASAFAVFTFGGWSAAFGTSESPEGVTFVPPVSPGVGWLAGPFVAAAMFYALTLVDELRARDSAHRDEVGGAGGTNPSTPRTRATGRRNAL